MSVTISWNSFSEMEKNIYKFSKFITFILWNCVYLRDNIAPVYIVLCDGVLLKWPKLGELALEKNKNVALHALWNQRYWTANYPGPLEVSAKFLQHWWCGKKQVSQRHARKGGVFRWGVWVVCWGRGQVLLPCYHVWQKAWNVKRSKVSHEEHQEQNLKAKSIFFENIRCLGFYWCYSLKKERISK